MPEMLNPDMMVVMRDVGTLFAEYIRDYINPDDMEEVVERNREEGPGSGICHTHDFCDANVPMDEAFSKVMGFSVVDGDAPSEEPDWVMRTQIWNEAWDYATTLWL